MKWEMLNSESDGLVYANILLDLETKIFIQTTCDALHMVRFGYAKFKGRLHFSMQNHKSGLYVETDEFPTPQEAAKAAVDLLAPFVQLSTLGGKP